MNNNQIGGLCEAANKEIPLRKFERLINASNELDGVKSHLTELYSVIGYQLEEIVCPSMSSVPPDNIKKPRSTLILTLNELPGKIESDIEGIHSMIQIIINELN